MRNKIIGVVFCISGFAIFTINLMSFARSFDFLMSEPMMMLMSMLVMLLGLLMMCIGYFQLNGSMDLAKELTESKVDFKTREEHRSYLIKLYRAEKEKGVGNFMLSVLDEAIRKLRMGVNPSKVEDWVVNCEKLWRAFP